jgi:FAD/FMN-containing dehydrogenase
MVTVERALTDIVGAEYVFADPEALTSYSKDESFAHPIRPRCVVKPKSMEEVQGIVKWANDTLTPLIPVSSAPPRFRGDTVPSVGGAVIAELGEMKRIIRVDRRNRVAMIEPGVTFGELIPELEKVDLAPFMPLLPRSTKSVVASWLEREPITMPRHHWETQDPLLCVEIIYGSGDLFRTGSAAGPGTIEEQWEVGRAQVRGMGPAQIDFAKLIQGAQGAMGIVTWATMKCKILPKAKRAFLVPADNVERLINLSYRLLWKRLDAECLILNDQNLASAMGENAAEIKALRQALPPWVLIFNLEGGGLMAEEKVKYQEAELRESAQMFGLEPVTTVARIKAEEVGRVLSKPSAEPYWKLRAKGGCHDIFFVTTLDRTPEFIKKAYELAGAYRYPAMDIGVYLQPTVQGTNCHCEFNLSYDPKSKEEVNKVKRFVTEGGRALANTGAFFSRPYGPWADIAYSRAAETVVALRKVKNIFDPNGIMNPGKLCF